MLQGIWRDLIYAGRSLSKARSFTIVCVVTLGIGMAPVIAIPYGARLLTMTPPLIQADGVAEVLTTRVGPRGPTDEWSYPDYQDLRAADTGMTLAGWATGKTTVQTAAGKTDSPTLFVSSNYFKTFRVALARGAGFEATIDDPVTVEPVVILAHTFWKNQLGSDPDALGKALTLNGVPHTVVGIGAELFEGHLAFQEADLFVPLERYPLLLEEKNVRSDRANEWVHIHGRLSPGVTVAKASAAVSTVTSHLAQQYTKTNENKTGIAQPYQGMGNLISSQFTLIKTVGLTLTGAVLLVVCLNISGMMQVRGAMRERELSIRQAIGANRGRLVQYLLAESMLLAGIGGTLASLVLFNIPSALSWMLGKPIPAQFQQLLRVDLSMIAFCFGLCLLASLVFGLLPAMRFSRPVIVSSLKDEAGGGGFRVGRIHRATAALQVAIAVPLLVMGGICLDRVRATATSDLGFAPDLLYAAPLPLSAGPAEDTAFQIRTARDSLAKATGVTAVTVADGLPLDFRYRIKRVALQTEANVAPKFVSAHVTRVGDGYLNTMGISLLRGRDFSPDDRDGAELVTIIAKPLAEALFPDTDVAEAIGKRLTFGVPGADNTQQTLTIVGITGDFPTSQMSTEREQLLLPLAQHPDVKRNSVTVVADSGNAPTLMLIARSAPGQQPAQLMGALENVIRERDPEFKASDIVTGAWLRKNSMDDFLSQSTVAAVAGGVILVLAALGIYGVVGLMVATRKREIAVRVALGASRARVIVMILFDVVKLVSPGVFVGMILTAALIRLNGENMGIPLSNVENLAYIAGAAIAVLVAVLASFAPARRAASVQPMIAMRSE
jgi:predicted permease